MNSEFGIRNSELSPVCPTQFLGLGADMPDSQVLAVHPQRPEEGWVGIPNSEFRTPNSCGERVV
jgi:hypothetical protein